MRINPNDLMDRLISLCVPLGEDLGEVTLEKGTLSETWAVPRGQVCSIFSYLNISLHVTFGSR